LEGQQSASNDTSAAWIDAVVFDSRLGVRLLVKHRGLTLVVGAFAMYRQGGA
jgi:hypothetical protein